MEGIGRLDERGTDILGRQYRETITVFAEESRLILEKGGLSVICTAGSRKRQDRKADLTTDRPGLSIFHYPLPRKELTILNKVS